MSVEYVTKQDLKEELNQFAITLRRDLTSEFRASMNQMAISLREELRTEFREYTGNAVHELRTEFRQYTGNAINELRSEFQRYTGALSEEFQSRLGVVAEMVASNTEMIVWIKDFLQQHHREHALIEGRLHSLEHEVFAKPK